MTPLGEITVETDRLASWLLRTIADDLDPDWGGGRMTASAYDTAAVASLREPGVPRQLAFPESFEWLLGHQAEDGSWGAPPQTLVPTLGGLLALVCAPEQSERVRSATAAAIRHLRTVVFRWSLDQYDAIAAETLVPRLLDQLDAHGITFDTPGCQQLRVKWRATLDALPHGFLPNPPSTLAHSLEAFCDRLDFTRVTALRSPDGNYGCSPSSTAAVLVNMPVWHTQSAAWLRNLAERAAKNGDAGAMPTSHPIDVFEAAWVPHNLATSQGWNNAEAPHVARLGRWLRESLRADGASWTRLMAVPPDCDDTGMAIVGACIAFGQTMPHPSAEPLGTFWRDGYFACYDGERTGSVAANAHALLALASVRTPPEQAVADRWAPRVAGFLAEQQRPEGSWLDKWHSSPLYATSRVVLALTTARRRDLVHAGTVAEPAQNAAEWLMGTRSAQDGGWTAAGGASTLEETAYGLQILSGCAELDGHRGPVADHPRYGAAFRQGFAHLWERVRDEVLPHDDVEAALERSTPKLWQGKELYMPTRVVAATITGALRAGAGAAT